MERDNKKAWLYLLPAILFIGVFMIYPLIDVFIYSFEEGYNSASQSDFVSTQLPHDNDLQFGSSVNTVMTFSPHQPVLEGVKKPFQSSNCVIHNWLFHYFTD